MPATSFKLDIFPFQHEQSPASHLHASSTSLLSARYRCCQLSLAPDHVASRTCLERKQSPANITVQEVLASFDVGASHEKLVEAWLKRFRACCLHGLRMSIATANVYSLDHPSLSIVTFYYYPYHSLAAFLKESQCWKLSVLVVALNVA